MFGGCGGTDSSCPLSSYKFPVAINIDGAGRDVHGELKSVNEGFIYKSFAQIETDFEVCLEELGEDEEEQEDIVLDCLKETFYGQIEYGFELVFGAMTSPGFVCGVKEAIKHHGKKLPGFCCLVCVDASSIAFLTVTVAQRQTV